MRVPGGRSRAFPRLAGGPRAGRLPLPPAAPRRPRRPSAAESPAHGPGAGRRGGGQGPQVGAGAERELPRGQIAADKPGAGWRRSAGNLGEGTAARGRGGGSRNRTRRPGIGPGLPPAAGGSSGAGVQRPLALGVLGGRALRPTRPVALGRAGAPGSALGGRAAQAGACPPGEAPGAVLLPAPPPRGGLGMQRHWPGRGGGRWSELLYLYPPAWHSRCSCQRWGGGLAEGSISSRRHWTVITKGSSCLPAVVFCVLT